MSRNSSVDSIFFPTTFETREIETNGVTIHARVGGQGPAVVMLHGFGTTSDMWAPLAAALVAEHTVFASSKRLGSSEKSLQNRNQRPA